MRASVGRFGRVFARVVAAGVLGSCALFALDAGAQKPPPKKPDPADARASKPAAVDVKPLVQKLQSGDEEQIRAALDDARLAGIGASGAAPAIADALKKGLSGPLTLAAIETLGDLEAEAGAAVLAQYATHRNAKMRRAAVKSLTRTKGAAAAPALKRALADADANVRGTAASGLGSLKAKDAVGELFVALDHRVNEAAASIGQLCSVDQCEQLAGKLGKLPFDVVTTGLDQVLFRPTAEISDDAKVKVIGRIRELGTIEGNKFLRDVQKRATAPAFSPRVRQALDQAVLATSGGAQ